MKLLISFLALIGWTIAQAGVPTLFVGNGSGLTNLPTATNATMLFVDPNSGNDSTALRGVKEKPWQSPITAAASAVSNDTIYVYGTNNLGTSVLNLPHYVNLDGPGELISSSDLNVSGCAVGLGTCSRVRNITITCDTNRVRFLIDNSGHSGYWAGIGCNVGASSSQKAFTNASVENVLIRKASTDCFYINTTALSTATIETCRFEGNWDTIAIQGNDNSRFKFIGCTLLSDETSSVFADISFDQGSIVNVASTTVELIGCFGSDTNVLSPLGFLLTGTAKVIISGGNYYDTVGWNSKLKGSLNWNGTNYFANTPVGNGSLLTNITPVVTNFTAYAAGTAYTLTATPALAHLGTTDPSVTINQAGTYLISCGLGVKYSGATYAGAQTITVKLRRTNNTAADLTGASRAVELPVLTTFTGGDAMTTPTVLYTATSGDIIQLFASVSATPAAGSVLIDSAEIVAIRQY